MRSQINVIKVTCSSPTITLGQSYFSDCRNLELLKLPTTVTTIPSNCCGGCTKLESINLDELENLTTIGSYAF